VGPGGGVGGRGEGSSGGDEICWQANGRVELSHFWSFHSPSPLISTQSSPGPASLGSLLFQFW